MTEAMQQHEHVQLSVSPEGIVRSLGDQFSRRSTFIQEMGQNARRAGATWVAFDIDEDRQAITVSDNGHGIDDPAKLLRVAESDWRDMEALEKETPFGIGFLATLYVSAHVAVETIDWTMSAHVEDLLAFRPVRVETPDYEVTGTKITLTFDDSQWCPERDKGMAALAEEIVRERLAGFSIAVYLNGTEIERSAALSPEFERFRLGWIRGIDTILEQPWSMTRTHHYLQGIPVDVASSRWPLAGHGDLVIHLDDGAFRARVPDRDQLIDPEESRRVIEQAVCEVVRGRLEAYKQQIEPTAFVEKYGRVTHRWAADLLDDMPLASADWFRYGQPASNHPDSGQCQLHQREPAAPDDTPVLLAAIHEVLTFDDEQFECERRGGTDMGGGTIEAAYAWASGLPVLDGAITRRSGHWAARRAIRLDDVDFDVNVIEPGERQLFCWNQEFWVRFCREIRLTPHHDQLEPVVVTGAAIRQHEQIDGCNQPVVIVPTSGDSFHYEATLLQAAPYMGQFEEFEEDRLDEDVALLRQLRAIARGSDVLDLVADAIRRNVSPTLLQAIQGRDLGLHVEDERTITLADPVQAD